MKPRLLDLFSGAGGAARGYQLAGFHVTGVDINPQPNYCGDAFVQADAMTFPLDGYDAIHASPPCQAYSIASVQQRLAGHEYPDLLPPTRARLEGWEAARWPGLWVIENVPGAPMRADVKLCGCMFELPMLRRERWFELSWSAAFLRPSCQHRGPTLSVTGHGVGVGNGQRGRIAAVLGRNPGIADARAAMGIDWMTRDELSEAIPPAYTEWLGALLIEALERAA